MLEIVFSIDSHKLICLVDSGATNNFISRNVAEKCGLDISSSDTITVRLADGQVVTTSAYTTAVVRLGELWMEMRFEILDAEVATIFGMPFLELANPQINWQTKTLKIKHRGRLIEIPTLSDAKA